MTLTQPTCGWPYRERRLPVHVIQQQPGRARENFLLARTRTEAEKRFSGFSEARSRKTQAKRAPSNGGQGARWSTLPQRGVDALRNEIGARMLFMETV